METEQSNYEQNMQDAIAVFPRLLTGLDINVKFNRYTHTHTHTHTINFHINVCDLIFKIVLRVYGSRLFRVTMFFQLHIL